MSEKTKATDKSAANMDYVTETGTKSLATIAEIHSRMLGDAFAFNTELLEFTKRRLAVDLETTEQLSKCKSVSDAVDVMGAFYQRAIQDYADETTTLFRLGEETARNAVGEPTTRNETGRLPD